MELNYSMLEEQLGHVIPRKEGELICFVFPIIQNIYPLQIQLQKIVLFMELSIMWGILNSMLPTRMPPVLFATHLLVLPW